MSLEELEKRIKAIEDLESIKKLHQHYINLMDNLRYQEVLDLFTEDATVEVRNSGVRGAERRCPRYTSIFWPNSVQIVTRVIWPSSRI